MHHELSQRYYTTMAWYDTLQARYYTLKAWYKRFLVRAKPNTIIRPLTYGARNKTEVTKSNQDR